MVAASTIPVVSVIIPCFNYGHFLAQAVDSVRQQTHTATEIIVVDDGSTDNTREVATRYPEVVYIYQKNKGLSAARNTGITRSTGDYLVFLDADDWLLPEALATNLNVLRQSSELAFCYGAYTAVYADGRRQDIFPPSSEHPYQDLLAKGNYIAMIATVMFARWALAGVRFDTSLPRCEDYDVYLRITRRYPVAQHQQLLAAYRIHAAALSAYLPVMLGSARQVLRRQQPVLRNSSEQSAYYQGIEFWRSYYVEQFRKSLAADEAPAYWPAMVFFLQYAPLIGYNYSVLRIKSVAKAALKSLLPAAAVRRLRRLKPLKHLVPPIGSVHGGDFQRPTPFSTNFGYDRGGAIDRYYIEGFLASEAASIRGRVLEIGDNAYTVRYGADEVHTSDILHIDATNPRATFVGDLSQAPHMPDDTFDCIILTQTLQFIYDFRGALATCYRILKPGGTLLLTVPGLSPLDKGEWREIWYWSFTDKALSRLMAEFFAGAEVIIGSFGNVWVATAFLYGMGITELAEQDLNFYDPQFQVINTVKATKPLPNA